MGALLLATNAEHLLLPLAAVAIDAAAIRHILLLLLLLVDVVAIYLAIVPVAIEAVGELKLH